MSTFRDFWVRAALVVSLLVPIYFLVAALGTKFGLFDWTFGFRDLTYEWGALRVLPGAAAFALIGLVVALFVPPRRGAVLAFLALLIPAAGLGYGFYVRAQAARLPPIHDISTDLIDPPAFSPAVTRARAAVTEANGLDLLAKHTRDGRAFIDVQREGYPDIASIPTGLDRARAFTVALNLAREQKWTLGAVDRQAGAIEATARGFWFGLTDDIVIRIRPDGLGARVDMRSVSRVGQTDLGVNAAHMRPYLQELRRRLQEAEG